MRSWSTYNQVAPKLCLIWDKLDMIKIEMMLKFITPFHNESNCGQTITWFQIYRHLCQTQLLTTINNFAKVENKSMLACLTFIKLLIRCHTNGSWVLWYYWWYLSMVLIRLFTASGYKWFIILLQCIILSM